jgi:hypothetical protein
MQLSEVLPCELYYRREAVGGKTSLNQLWVSISQRCGIVPELIIISERVENSSRMSI